jgi:hypothetical protein
MNKNTLMVIGVILIIVAGVGGFFGGVFYQKSQRPNLFANGAGGQMRGNGQFVGRFGGANNSSRPVIGKIISVDQNGMTVKMTDGNTKIVIVSSNTLVNKAATGSKSDLKTGETVAAFGTANSDGSITAQNIQLNPQTRMGGTPR